MQLATRAACNTFNLQYLQLTTHAIRNMCHLQHVQFATRAICNMYNLQHVQLVTCSMSIMQCARIPPYPLWKWRGPYLVRRVVPHLRGVMSFFRFFLARGHQGHWRLQTFAKAYIVFSLQFDFLNLFDLIYFFHLNLKDFLKLSFQRFLKKRFEQIFLI